MALSPGTRLGPYEIVAPPRGECIALRGAQAHRARTNDSAETPVSWPRYALSLTISLLKDTLGALSGRGESHVVEALAKPHIDAQWIPLRRNGEVHERRIAACDRGVEMPERLAQIAGFAVKQRQLHRWTVGVGAQRELDDAGATATVVTLPQFVDQLQRAPSRPRVRERLRHVPIEIAFLQVRSRQVPRASMCCGSISSARVAHAIMSS